MSAQGTLTQTFDAFNRHDADAFAALYAPDAVVYDPQYAEPLQGREAIRKDMEDFFASFPDVQATLSNVLTSDDIVACEMELTGTNKGPILTPTGTLAATNRQFRMPGSRFAHVNEQGLITMERRYFDMAALMQQLELA
ncbi:MAG: hypothetical protein KatS3mg051_2121 [Anaerolineae bacterium]|nr:MAG: hypothetical protein KatS3mg050_4310 [Litorilinea sp.]GIV82767.1 MAG: hypothetical protein KatS3mg051_2121 [Anaerolineae bacterium]